MHLLPVLTDDDSRRDWPEAVWRTDIAITGAKATITQHLSGAAQLCDLVESGAARWIVEVRCPRTLSVREHTSNQPVCNVSLADEGTVGATYVVCGLAAVRPLTLTSDGLNPFTWPAGTALEVPAGYWLARGRAHATRRLVASLLRLRCEETLPPGAMCAREAAEPDGPYFLVDLAPDLHAAHRDDRTIHVAALIAACGLLPGSTLAAGGDNADHPRARDLRARLAAAAAEFPAGAMDWDSDAFDPASAATALEPFHAVSPQSPGEE